MPDDRGGRDNKMTGVSENVKDLGVTPLSKASLI